MAPTRLALIEDHPALRQGLELLLDRAGCVVVATAGDFESGLAAVREHEPDVIVVDIALGGESGILLTRELLHERPGRRVVLYTGSRDGELLAEGLESGALGYALKEGAPSELFEAIRVVAAGDTYVDPRLRPAMTARPPAPRPPALSAREREVMQLLALGHTGDEVAEVLFLSAETVKTHIRNAVSKLEARNRVHAIAIALRAGLIRATGEQAPVR